MIADVGRAIAMATGGAIAFAVVELVLTLVQYAGPVESKLRFAALVGTLSVWLWLLVVIPLALVLAGARYVRSIHDPVGALGRGWLDPSPLVRGVRPGVPRLWAIAITAAIVGVAIQRVAARAIVHFKEPQLTAGLVAAIAVAGLAFAVPLRRFATFAALNAAEAVAPMFGIGNPLGRWRAAGGVFAGLVGAALAVTWYALPQSRSVLPVRLVCSGIALAAGMGAGALVHARWKRPARSRGRALALAGGALLLVVPTFMWWGADETKWVAITASPALDKLITTVRYANDLDGDGYGSLLGENDCAPLDSSIHPGAKDIPDDGIDQNCDGHDFSLHTAAAPPGPRPGVPAQFKKPWNVLFITIDTLRYDHTTFGGYATSPKKRDTTPRLSELVKQATSFTFCNAPSAGTMASIPAIITSKYFHSGLALDEHVEPGMPPRLKPENTLLSEIMKRGGYHTGVIASHEYWNDWGMEQGVDDYDNTIGKTPDPWRVAADQVTDRALAWISRQQGRKWFLWAHYIDPHGRYVAHPDVVDYGSSEPDLYDAEIKWTDQQIGRLLDELQRMPSTPNTIIVITSDHGDSMGEHTVPVGTHGTALYFELQHVPMIFYIPNNPPRQIGGAVSNLDIVPTIAELTGIDVHDLSFEGRSEVPAIFYGIEDHARIVFAETNAPAPQRAAISERYKLIYYLNSNLYEFFDLKTDPTEHANLASQKPPAMAEMKRTLDDWLERVVYSRDKNFNQATERINDVLLAAPPAIPVATAGQTLDHGNVAIDGIGLADGGKVAPSAKVDVQVYFTTNQHTDVRYKLGIVVWPIDPATWKPTDPIPEAPLRSGPRETAEGFFPSDHWRPGEHVRERFKLTLPATWAGQAMAVGLVAVDQTGAKAVPTGAAAANDASVAILGVIQ